MERVYVGLMDRVSGSMGSGVGVVRVRRAVGRALDSGTVAAGSSEGVWGWKRPTAERALASGTFKIWDGRGKPFICGSSGVWDRRSNR